jgi:hypothetical protein
MCEGIRSRVLISGFLCVSVPLWLTLLSKSSPQRHRDTEVAQRRIQIKTVLFMIGMDLVSFARIDDDHRIHMTVPVIFSDGVGWIV